MTDNSLFSYTLALALGLHRGIGGFMGCEVVTGLACLALRR